MEWTAGSSGDVGWAGRRAMRLVWGDDDANAPNEANTKAATRQPSSLRRESRLVIAKMDYARTAVIAPTAASSSTGTFMTTLFHCGA